MSQHIHLLVRGVILVDQHVLIAHTKGASNTFLPGGHVEWGESLPQTLTRELAEELGHAAQVTAYLGAVEHLWGDDAHQQHEINHVFAATLAGVTSMAEPLIAQEAHLEFVWAPLAALANHHLLPAPLIALIQQYASDPYASFWASTFATTN